MQHVWMEIYHVNENNITVGGQIIVLLSASKSGFKHAKST